MCGAPDNRKAGEPLMEDEKKMLLERDFDVFIAYHGTESPRGSKPKAQKIYDLLTARGIDCFFFPVTNLTGSFSDTPTIAKHAKLFLLIANGTIPTNTRHEVSGVGLYNEIQAFYSGHCFREVGGGSGKARVYAYDGLPADRADDLHILFSGVAHFVEGAAADPLGDLVRWVERSLALPDHPADPVTPVSAPPPARLPERAFEGIWILSGDFSSFQGDSKKRYMSSGRLILTWDPSCYKAIYCYSVSREFDDQPRVTSICEGISSFEDGENGQELVITCDILSRTSVKKMSNSNRHFQLRLTPKGNVTDRVNTMTSIFRTKNTEGVLTFTRSR